MILSRRWPVLATWTALLAAAGLTSWLLLRSHSATTGTTRAQAGAQQPDYLLHHATLTRFARDGKRRYVIHARKITHLPANDVALLDEIDLNYFSNAGTNWHLTADKGRLNDHGQRLDLSGHIHANQIDVATPIQFDTSTLTLFLPSEKLRTSAEVVLYQGHRETRGQGLAANLRTGTLSLLKNVRSRYVP